jgi:hypothetical protein
MSTPPIVTQYGGSTPYKLTNFVTGNDVFTSNTPFYPNQISDLAIWLDGKDILNNGSNNPKDEPLTSWANKGNNLISVYQNNTNYQPYINDLEDVYFTNNNGNGPVIVNGLNTDYTSGNNETVFIILSNITTNNDYNLLYNAEPDQRQLYLVRDTLTNTILTTALSPNVIKLSSGNVPIASPTLVSYWNSNGSIKHYINGLLSGTVSFSPFSRTGVTFIGTDNYIGNNGFNGTISEIIIYSNVLSDDDRQKVESYLFWKWKNFTLNPLNPYANEPYSNVISLYPNIDSNLIPPVPRDLVSDKLDSNSYPLIKNFITLPNTLQNVKF